MTSTSLASSSHKEIKPPFFLIRTLITREIVCSKKTQVNTKNDLKMYPEKNGYFITLNSGLSTSLLEGWLGIDESLERNKERLKMAAYSDSLLKNL